MANINYDAVDAALEWRMAARAEGDNIKSCAVFLTTKLI